jgi:hypothetical protein
MRIMHNRQGHLDARQAAAFNTIADAVLAAEDASDAAIAAAGSLLTMATANRVATGVPINAAQRVLNHLEKMVISQFDSRRALLDAHSSLSAIARVARNGSETAWGPDSDCPAATVGPEVVELRSVA